MPNQPMDRTLPDRMAAMSVTEISRMVERAVRGMPREVFVRGDLINISRGTIHLFASLGDGGHTVRVFVHSQVVSRLEAVPSEGTAVIVRATPSWYRARGDVQLVVRELWIADGAQARRESVARIRIELERQGVLRANRELHLPRLPKAIAVVGATGSAAVLDVVNAVHRRSPGTHIAFQPTRLQGAGADEGIAAAIRAAAASGAEAVAVVRGGGGADDFAPFDSRLVCEAIAASRVPIVTALGHEQDRTLADQAAHSSASTPTDAARFLVADVVDVRRELVAVRRRLFLALRSKNGETQATGARKRGRLASALAGVIDRAHLRLRAADVRRRLPGIGVEVDRQRREVAALRERLVRAGQEGIAVRRRSARAHADVLGRAINDRSRAARQRVEALGTRLRLAEPDAVVARGFIIARTAEGQTVMSASDARQHDLLDLQFPDGILRVRVRHTQEGEHS